jgi:hypothetical protein
VAKWLTRSVAARISPRFESWRALVVNKKVMIGLVVLLAIVVIGYFVFNSSETINEVETGIKGSGVGESPVLEGETEEEEDVGPGGCRGMECNQYCSENSEECDAWCAERPDSCAKMMEAWSDDSTQQEKGENQQPNGDEYLREGDGVWEKNELTFFIKDEENVLTDKKRKIIQDVFFSEKESGGGFWGWNAALEELNRLYPDNIVPDRFVEIDSEENADFVMAVHTDKEFCCDYGGDPVKGRERSKIDSNFAKIKSNVDIYDVVNMEAGFFSDVARHEVGHGIGLFGHVVNRKNDLMSIVSPDSEIKKGNLDDLYIKYRDRIIESNEEAIEKDLKVKDEKVRYPA